jgi:hypothetical protein
MLRNNQHTMKVAKKNIDELNVRLFSLTFRKLTRQSAKVGALNIKGSQTRSQAPYALLLSYRKNDLIESFFLFF